MPNISEIVGRMSLKEMVGDRQKFAELVKENAMPDLAEMGLDIVSFNVQNFIDENGVIADLGIDNISQIKKTAAIAKANADKEVAVAKAEAAKQANDARVKSELEIATKNNELEIQKAELKKQANIKKAEADAIRAKSLAEAEGMEKKAEAYQKYNNAAMAEMLIRVLPDVAGKIAEPLSKIDKITIIGGRESDGVGSVAGNVPVVMAKLFESMKATTGIDLSDVVKADTYDAKVNRNISINGIQAPVIDAHSTDNPTANDIPVGEQQ